MGLLRKLLGKKDAAARPSRPAGGDMDAAELS